jgi:hypothetical protein
MRVLRIIYRTDPSNFTRRPFGGLVSLDFNLKYVFQGLESSKPIIVVWQIDRT